MGAVKEITREVIERWEQHWPALKALNDETLTLDRGQEIAVERCVAICGDESSFRKIAKRWKECLLWLRGITVEYSRKSRAYRMLQVEEHLCDRNTRVMLAAEKRHRTEALRLGLMRDEDLRTDHQRRLRALMMHQHSDTAGKIEAQREHARIGYARPETLPRINGS